ncbi:MAG: glycine zipper 2TM domain-containing protein [Alphaproteobacteria bacterium]|nr:glycine zipper 2TM domain-containing protein [Alphaproteobacteria bacterium]MCB9928018.1 glycine zipper 2TM domain-containing protein [Alphaproteobacteria bacterium]
MRRFAVVIAIPLALAACESGNEKQTAGTVLGGVAGGLIGSTIGSGSGKTAAIIAGAAIGALAGNQLGAALDEQDRDRAARNTQTALEDYPTGNTATWRNPDNGNYGTTTPTSTYTDENGQPCREYTTTVTVAGKKQQAYGRACRDAEGNWRIVS